MASYNQANRVREKFSGFLREKDAHAISVDEIKHGGTKTFAVVAYFEKQPEAPLPNHLELKQGSKTLRVPLKVRVLETFKPE